MHACQTWAASFIDKHSSHREHASAGHDLFVIRNPDASFQVRSQEARVRCKQEGRKNERQRVIEEGRID